MLPIIRLILKFGLFAELVMGGIKFVKSIFRKLSGKNKAKLTGEEPAKLHSLPAAPTEEPSEYIPVPEIIEEEYPAEAQALPSSTDDPAFIHYKAGDAVCQLEVIATTLGLNLTDQVVRETQLANLRNVLSRLNLTVDNCSEGIEALINSLAFNREDSQKLRAQVAILKSRLDALRTVLVIVKEDYIVRDAHGAGFSILSGEALRRRKRLIQSVLKEEFFHQLGIGEEVSEVGLVFDVDFHPEGLFMTAHVHPDSKVEFNSEGLGLYREVAQALIEAGFPAPELEDKDTTYTGDLAPIDGQKIFISDLEKHKLIRLYYGLKAWGKASLLLFG